MDIADDQWLTVLQAHREKIETVDDPNMIATEGFDDTLSLFWHGEPSESVHSLIAEARSVGVHVVVHQRPWTRSDLVAARDRVGADTALRADLDVTLLGLSKHADGVMIGLRSPHPETDWEDAKARLQAVAGEIPVQLRAVNPVAFPAVGT